MKKRAFLSTAISLGLVAFPLVSVVSADQNELVAVKIVEALRSSTYSVDEIKPTGAVATAVIRNDGNVIELTLQPFASVREAQQQALGAAGRVSAGLKSLSWDKNQTALLHRQFLYAHKGAIFFKLESKSGDQKENLKKAYEAIMPSLLAGDENSLRPVLAALKSAGYEAEMSEHRALRVSNADQALIVTVQQCATIEDARSQATSALRKDMGARKIFYNENESAFLHPTFLYAHRGPVFMKIESESGNQSEAIKQLFDIIWPALSKAALAPPNK